MFLLTTGLACGIRDFMCSIFAILIVCCLELYCLSVFIGICCIFFVNCNFVCILLFYFIRFSLDPCKLCAGEKDLGSWKDEILSSTAYAPGPANVVSTLVLAENRTERPDILSRFHKYRGGWDIANKHYWAVSTHFLCFVTASLCPCPWSVEILWSELTLI